MARLMRIMFICLIVNALNAQSERQESLKCVELLSLHSDGTITEQYDQHTVAEVARCHVRKLDNLMAARWFEKIADLPECKPEYLLEYGQCLKSLKLYGKAKFYFQKYAQSDPVLGNQFMQSCDIAKMMLDGDQLYQVTGMNTNTMSMEYAPIVLNGKVIYSAWAPTAPSASLNMCSLQGGAVQSFNTGIAKHQISHLRYSSDGKFAVFATNGFVVGQRLLAEHNGTQIYYSEMTSADKWSEPVLLPFGGETYSTGYPAVSDDGAEIFFASTMPGGQGGWDIYVSRRTGDIWSTPVNLGEEINTPGDEISPMVSENRLYFSSDWHVGIGGFDVFVVSRDGMEFGYVQNAGSPVNSPKDDLDFFWDPSGSSAYFTSNRIGGIGLYDIYRATPLFKEIEFSVMHKDNRNPVDRVTLAMSPGAVVTYTNARGSAILHQPLTGEREIHVKKDGFKEQVVKLTGGANSTNSYQIYLEPVIRSSSSQPGEVRIVGETKPEKNDAPVVKAPGGEKKASSTAVAKEATMREMYFIQIAALARHASLDPYEVLRSYGDLIVHEEGAFAKVRLGTFATEAEAKLVLSRIKAEGYKDAFVVKQAVSGGSTQSHTSSYGSAYKVRLGTYAKVGNFNPDLVMHLGSIESYRKDELTIMLLAGYANLTAAQKARDAAASQGFTDAYVVMDNGGVFERVR